MILRSVMMIGRQESVLQIFVVHQQFAQLVDPILARLDQLAKPLIISCLH